MATHFCSPLRNVVVSPGDQVQPEPPWALSMRDQLDKVGRELSKLMLSAEALLTATRSFEFVLRRVGAATTGRSRSGGHRQNRNRRRKRSH